MNTDFNAKLDAIYDRLQKGLRTQPRDYDWRMQQLRQLKRMIEDNEDLIFAALWKDLHKGPAECETTEQGVVLSEITYTLKHLKSWMKPERASTPLYNMPGRSLIYREPLGLTLIMGAWNYPFQLTIAPLVGAIAGGNGALIKPPDMTPATAQVIETLITKYMDPDLFAVVQGGREENDLILKKKYDLIFFTGGTTVAQVVMTAAVPNLTPVILELGGKSPAVVLPDADIKVAARRLTWGKFMNAGQTCIAPDYIIAHPQIREQLVSEMRTCLKDFYGSDIQTNKDYCRIVNTGAFDRLVKLTDGTQILIGGKSDRADLFIEPTVVLATPETEIMKHEIFGPILPIIEMANTDEIMTFINSRPKPLALYLFTTDGDVKEKFMKRTTSGSLVMNDVVIHMPEPGIPFGGVGLSGMGNYHGKFSFDTFTHAKGVLRKTTMFDVPVRYPPYNKQKSKILKWLLG